MEKKTIALLLFFINNIYSQVSFSTEIIEKYNTEGAYDIKHVDLDLDGDLDFVGSTIGEYSNIGPVRNSFLWFENDGEECFTTHIVSDADTFGSKFYIVRAGDMDGDGDIDLIGSTDTSLVLFINDGNQEFELSILSSVHNMIQEISIVDIDADNDLDILIAAYESDTFSLYKNNGSGVFEYQQISQDLDYTNGASDIDVVDLDNDGDLDLIAASYNSSVYIWFENDGNLNFTLRLIEDSGDYAYGARSIAAADLDNDGDIDIAGASEKGGTYVWFRNDGNQNFTPLVIEDDNSIAGEANTIRIADIDNDGALDILGSSRASAASGYYWFKNNPENTTNIFKSINGQSNLHELYTGAIHSSKIDTFDVIDINQDGLLDFYSTSRRNTFTWFENDGELNFNSHYIDLSRFALSSSMKTGDLDGDGDIDLAVTSASSFTWFENRGNNEFKPHIIDQSITYTEQSKSIVIEDMDGDGDLDIIGASYYAREPGKNYSGAYVWYMNDGIGNFEFNLIDYSGSFSRNANSVIVADFDGDGDMDAVGASSYLDNQFVLYRNDGAQNFEPEFILNSNSISIRPHFVNKLDVDGDGDMDVLGVSNSNSTFLWFENDGLGNFTYHVLEENIYNIHYSASLMKGADIDNDGDNDIMVHSAIFNKFGWFENDGSENFSFHKIELDFNSRSFNLLDINNDTFIDFIITGNDLLLRQYINDGTGNYTGYLIENNSTEGNSSISSVLDFNNDNYPDLFVQYSYFIETTLRLYLNEGESSLSVQDGALKKDEFIISPNPVKNDQFLNISRNSNSNIVVEFYDLKGLLLMQNQYETKNINLKMNTIGKGVYFLRMTNDRGEKMVFKVIRN